MKPIEDPVHPGEATERTLAPPSGCPAASGRPRILVVDDDPAMRALIAASLEEHAFRVDATADGLGTRQTMASCPPDLVVLDLNLRGEDGMDLARKLREDSQIPIVMVTGRSSEVDRVMALELGADDFVPKPFSARELVARVRAVLRRYHAHALPTRRDDTRRAYRFCGWELNLRSRRLVDPDGRRVELSNGEFNLLVAFCSAPFQVLRREQLLDQSHVYGADEVYDRAVDAQILRLRRKICSDPSRPRFIRTERGAGYVFSVPVEALY